MNEKMEEKNINQMTYIPISLSVYRIPYKLSYVEPDSLCLSETQYG